MLTGKKKLFAVFTGIRFLSLERMAMEHLYVHLILELHLGE